MEGETIKISETYIIEELFLGVFFRVLFFPPQKSGLYMVGFLVLSKTLTFDASKIGFIIWPPNGIASDAIDYLNH